MKLEVPQTTSPGLGTKRSCLWWFGPVQVKVKRKRRKKKKKHHEVPEVDPDSVDTEVAHVSKLKNWGRGRTKQKPKTTSRWRRGDASLKCLCCTQASESWGSKKAMKISVQSTMRWRCAWGWDNLQSPSDRRAFGSDVRPSKLDEIVDKDWPRSWKKRRKRKTGFCYNKQWFKTFIKGICTRCGLTSLDVCDDVIT